ncbi:unnamed protein product [Somion occarium]|uniref:Coenzyme Q-binding protein COQ10 START domain-containing protein n=1 Tax=Somion occarium TaxID=3059160 RepID=A0ABP1CR68_9APHY
MSGPTPPRAEDGVFTMTASATIDAPVEKVWNVLLDFPSYPEWNPFVRSQVVVDAANKPLDDQTPKLGSTLILTVNIPPGKDGESHPQKSHEIVTLVDHENHRVAWRYASLPNWLLNAERWQSISLSDDGKAKYDTVEVFGGPVAYLVKWITGKDLKKSFDAFADALKKRSEER